jgi:hypothetical protein
MTIPGVAAAPMSRATVPWGMLAAIDLHGCDRARLADPDTIRRFVPAVIEAIGMRAHGPLAIERFGDAELEGWSAMQFMRDELDHRPRGRGLLPLLRRRLLVPSLRSGPRGGDRGSALRR